MTQSLIRRLIGTVLLACAIAPVFAIELADDDVRSFPAPPAGFSEPRKEIAQGRVVPFEYTSNVTGKLRSANVYLPPGYPAQGRVPVLYLLHGIAGNQHEWTGYVHAQAILDKLIADGRAVPMIVVMPNGRALPDDRPPPQERMFTPEHVAGFAAFERELLGALIPAIDAKYATIPDRRHRAIAGLSMGGGQALNFGLRHLDRFAWVGGFSSAPNTGTASQLLPDPEAARRQLALLYLSCGKQDGLIERSQAFHRDLKQRGIPHVWNVDDYGHDRESWAENLYQFAQQLFRSPGDAVRQRVRIDDGWRFAFGHAYDAARDFNHGTRPFFFAKAGYGDGPADPGFEDRAWRKVDLPHDWAVELPFDPRGDTNHGSKAIGRAFPENSVGWYRRALQIPASAKGRRIALEFDGIYRDSVVWVNGHYMGREPSGYSSARYDITDYLNYGGKNVVAVRVDASGEEGWWYEGAGIYRHVWLTQTDPLHVDRWGSFVRSTVHGEQAQLSVDVSVRNDGAAAQSFSLEHELRDPDGRLVARRTVSSLHVGVDATTEVAATLDVAKARLWSLETPQLYKLTTLVKRGAQVVDRYDTPFGIRTIRFDANQGFFLNGRHVKLHGADNHQDHAGIGIALPDAMHEFRLRRMKAMGVNAIRSAHHPATPELLDACDRLGILVIDEHRMMGTAPQLRNELERMVRRDRNHPSIVLWSVGNEEWAIENNEIGTRLARAMQAIVHRLDPTRPTTLAASSSGAPEGTSVGSQVIGFNYKAQHDIDAMHRRFPERPMLLTEEGLTHATRGVYADDPAHVHVPAYDRRSGGASTATIEESWRFNAERPFLAGYFVWTAFDYRGETSPYGWPAISSQFGMLDTTGAMKDSAYYLKAAWDPAPMVHLLPHWNWPGREGQPIDVRVVGNTDEVELLLNGRSLGRQPLERYGHLQWNVPYASGSLIARGYRAGQLVASDTVATTGDGSAVRLSADRTRLQADGRDVSVIDVSVVDREGRVVPTASQRLQFEVSGPARLIGMGNGDPGSHEADKPTERHRYVGAAGWRLQGVASADEAAAKVGGDDSGTWRDPFQWVPEHQRPADSAFNVVRTRIPRPETAPGDRLVLFLADIAPGQRVFVNGRETPPRREEGSPVVDIDAATAPAAIDLAYAFATPSRGMRPLLDAAQSGARWALLRVTTPAGPWQRSVFNGHAQVIVQSTGAPGTVSVSAHSEGLTTGTVRLEVDPS